MSNQVTPTKPKPITIKDLYEMCLRKPEYFKTLIDGKDDLAGTLLKDGFVLSAKDCESLKVKLGNEKMTDLAKKWLRAGRSWEQSRQDELDRRHPKGKAGGGAEKGPDDENCHWDDTV
jgi:hypothetical protein